MAWIEVHQSLRDHRKVLTLAEELSVDPPTAIGHLVLLWTWALDNAPNGDITEVKSGAISRAAQYAKSGVRLLSALETSGFVRRTSDGRLELNDWYLYTGRLIERRAADAERKRSVRRTSVGHPQDVRRMSGVTQPNRTSPDRTEPDHTPPIVPPSQGGTDRSTPTDPELLSRPRVVGCNRKGPSCNQLTPRPRGHSSWCPACVEWLVDQDAAAAVRQAVEAE